MFSVELTHHETGTYAPSSIVAKMDRTRAAIDPWIERKLRRIGIKGVQFMRGEADRYIYGASPPPSAARDRRYMEKRRLGRLRDSIRVTQRGKHWVRIGVSRLRLRALSGQVYPYHLALNYGTIKMQPRPFMTQAWRKLGKWVKQVNWAEEFVKEAYK